MEGHTLMKTKRCSCCKKHKALPLYYKNKRSSDGRQGVCKECNKTYTVSAVMKTKYGITLEDYDTMLACQNGGCAICGTPPPGANRFHIDHDHGTGEVRGLLCHNCNVGLGHFNDNTNTMLKAIDYLNNHAKG